MILNIINQFSSILMPIFYKVLYLTIIGSIVGIIIYIIRTLFDKKISEKWKCILWFIVLASLIIPIRLELKVENQVMENEIISKAENIKNMPYEELYSKNILEFENNKITDSEEVIENQELSPKESIETYKKNIPIKYIINLSLPYIWILGSLIYLISLVQTTRKINRKISKQIYKDERIENILQEVKSWLNIRRKIKIVLQEYKKIPSIYGMFEPAILISESTLKEDDETIKYIFMHELSHYKRRDILLNYLLLIIVSIHWFNPVVWFIYKNIRQDIELGADELVLESLNKEEKKQYGLVLINSLRRTPKEAFSSVLCISDDSKNMERRIHMIKGKKKSVILSAILVIIIMLVIGGIVFINVTNKETDVTIATPDEISTNNSEETNYEKVWTEPLKFGSYEEYVAYNKSQNNYEVNAELTDEEKASIISEDEAKQKIKEVLEKLDYKNPYIGNLKIHKNYIESSQIIYEADVDDTIRIDIDAKTGSLEWLSDNKANFRELKRDEISEEKAREIATDLFEKTGFNNEYKLNKCKEGTFASGQIYNTMWEASFNKFSEEGVLNTYEYATIVFLVTDGDVYINTIGKRGGISSSWCNKDKIRYDNNPVIISEEKAIEIAKEIDKKFENKEITYTKTILSTNPVNHYVWLMEKTNGEDGYGSFIVETGENSSTSYPAYYYPKTIIRNSYCVCLAHQSENNFEGRAYYVDATTGEVIGGQGYYIPE